MTPTGGYLRTREATCRIVTHQVNIAEGQTPNDIEKNLREVPSGAHLIRTGSAKGIVVLVFESREEFPHA